MRNERLEKELAELRAENEQLKRDYKEKMIEAACSLSCAIVERDKARDMVRELVKVSEKLLERAHEIQDEKENYGPMLANQLIWLCDVYTKAQKFLKDSGGGE